MLKNWSRLLLSAFLWCAATAAAEAEQLDTWLENPDELWETGADSLLKRFPKALAWRDAGKTALYCRPGSASKFRFLEYPAYDLRFGFADNKLAVISCSVYNRGDAGEWRERDFRDALRTLSAELSRRASGVRSLHRSARLPGTKMNSEFWNADKYLLELSCGVGKGGAPEFISVEISRPGTDLSSLRAAMRSKVSAASLPGMVRRENGEHYIALPMIDQGSKGYCVPVTIERVLLYCGSDVDQHALARMLNADPKQGVSIPLAVDMLEKIDAKLGFKFEDKYRFPDFDRRRFPQFMKRYNGIAKRRKLAQISASELRNPDAPPPFSFEVFSAVRNADPRRRDQFFESVKREIDRGIPVFWSVLLFPEKGDGKVTGHLRIIVGYDERDRSILYSDSWGVGHEKKRMSLEDAWAITTRTFVLFPAK